MAVIMLSLQMYILFLNMVTDLDLVALVSLVEKCHF